METPAIVTQLLADMKPTTDEWTRQIFEWANPAALEFRATQGWPMTELNEALLALAAYCALVFVGVVLKMMSGPEPEGKKSASMLDPLLKPFIFVYNCSQVALCGWMIYETLVQYQKQGYQPVCNAFDMKNTGIAKVLYVFYMSKYLDFFDTLFIVLRGKWRQLSFLHTYHHVSIAAFYWLNATAAYDGDIYLTIVLNGAVHFVMYGYYVLTTLGIGWARLLRRYITTMQMTQFLIMNAQAIYILVNGCPYPRNVTIAYLAYIISLFALFANFFRKAYTPKKKTA